MCTNEVQFEHLPSRSSIVSSEAGANEVQLEDLPGSSFVISSEVGINEGAT
jgi:hypothetical protein